MLLHSINNVNTLAHMSNQVQTYLSLFHQAILEENLT